MKHYFFVLFLCAFLSSGCQQTQLLEKVPRQGDELVIPYEKYQLDKDYKKEKPRILNTITEDEIDALTERYIRPDRMHIPIVGNKEKILPGLKGLGYAIIALDTRGNPVKMDG